MTTQSAKTPWLQVFKPQREARLRLLCFPYAGGGASLFRAWAAAAPPEVEICAVQLPGRESRLSHPPLDGLAERLLPALAEQVLPLFDRPLAFFGYSMGALIGYDLARHLRDRAGREPAALAVAAYQAPHLPYRAAPIHHLPDEEFIARLRLIGGTPSAVLDNPEFMELMLPALRADFKLCETYRHLPGPPLACPVTAFGGLDDQRIAYADIAAWRQHAAGRFRQHMFAGGHFFFHDAQELLLREVLADLAPLA